MQGYTILEFYKMCLGFFSMIIDAGKNFWAYLSTDIGSLNDSLPDNVITDIGDWLVSPIANYSILEIGLGAGLNIFLVFSLIKFFKII